jgi:hypothetical protein
MNCKHLNLAFGAEKCPMVKHGTSLDLILETGFGVIVTMAFHSLASFLDVLTY